MPAKSTVSPVQQVVRKMIARLKTKGWVQGVGVSGERMCLIATHQEVTKSGALKAFAPLSAKAIEAAIPYGDTMVSFNDSSRTSKSDVLNLLEAVDLQEQSKIAAKEAAARILKIQA